MKLLSGYTRWRKGWANVSSELAQERRAWDASVCDVVCSIGEAGSNHSSKDSWVATLLIRIVLFVTKEKS